MTNIYIADDHQLIIDGIKSILKSPSINFVGSANNGLIAKQEINGNCENINIVIADINMPELTGIELCNHIKKNYSNIRVLIMSMYDNKAVIRESILAEADGYILKTSSKHEFQLAIKQISSGKSYYSEEIIPIIMKELRNESSKKLNLDILSEREIEILKLIVAEYTSMEIGTKLSISKKTVDKHRENILAKTDCKSIIGLVKFAYNAGLIIDPERQ